MFLISLILNFPLAYIFFIHDVFIGIIIHFLCTFFYEKDFLILDKISSLININISINIREEGPNMLVSENGLAVIRSSRH